MKDEEELKKFNLEQSVSGGPINRLPSALKSEVESDNKKDFLVHLKYFPKENKYGFAIYKEK